MCSRQLTNEKAFKICDISGDNTKQIIVITGHQPAINHFRHLYDSIFKARQYIVNLFSKRTDTKTEKLKPISRSLMSAE